MSSAIYSGKVYHRRFEPKLHEFEYPDTMFYLDIDELFHSSKRELKNCAARFYRSDHIGADSASLKDSINEILVAELGFLPGGSINVLTHIRQLGYVMNPVSFYYCWSEDDSRLEAIVAEVHNTPWGETHCYAFRFEHGESNEFRFQKKFHVSPFMPMGQEYVWRFSQPNGEIMVEMQNWEDGNLKFEAKLALTRQELTEQSLRLVLVKKPFLTISVIVRIYFQALKLWFKRIPTFSHPAKHGKSEASK